jgi:hypothetical protein
VGEREVAAPADQIVELLEWTDPGLWADAGLSDQWCKWRFHDQLAFVGIRSAKVIAKAFRAGFHLVAHRV